jgi:hypothetical protein
VIRIYRPARFTFRQVQKCVSIFYAVEKPISPCYTGSILVENAKNFCDFPLTFTPYLNRFIDAEFRHFPIPKKKNVHVANFFYPLPSVEILSCDKREFNCLFIRTTFSKVLSLEECLTL